jgi:hypothetical protein
MKFVTHNEEDIDMSSCLQGYVKTTYSHLCELFGKPTDGDGCKVDAEWVIKFEDETVATIYNWKDGKNYNGDSGMNVEEITDWHIGGKDKESVARIKEVVTGEVSVS